MTIRDERWEKVYASIGIKEDFRSYELDEGLNLSNWYEIKIELWHEHMYYYRFELIHEDDWDQFTPEVIAFVLNEMAASIDERLDEQAKRGASCHHFGDCVLDGDCPLFENCYLIGKENNESRAEATPEDGAGEAR